MTWNTTPIDVRQRPSRDTSENATWREDATSKHTHSVDSLEVLRLVLLAGHVRNTGLLEVLVDTDVIAAVAGAGDVLGAVQDDLPGQREGKSWCRKEGGWRREARERRAGAGKPWALKSQWAHAATQPGRHTGMIRQRSTQDKTSDESNLECFGVSTGALV